MSNLEKESAAEIPVRVLTLPSAKGCGHAKIVLLKLDRIGDFMTALEAFRLLRRAFAKAEITLFCLPEVADLAQSTGLFDKVKAFSPVGDDRVARFQSLLEGPYFLAADFRHDPFDRFGLDHIDARYRAAFIAQTEKGLDIVIPIMEWDAPAADVKKGKNLPVHAEVRLTLLAHAIIETLLEKTVDADIFHVPEDRDDVPAFRQLETQKKMKIGIGVGAGSPLRRWPVEAWRSLLRELAVRYDACFVFFGDAEDKAVVRDLCHVLGEGAFYDLTGSMNLAHVPVYMNLLDGYIGCDTGLTHVAGNLGVPTVNLFAGISNASVWRARGPMVKTLMAEAPCAPCHKRLTSECTMQNVCMTAIAPAHVLSCFEALLKEVSSAV